MIAVQTGYLKTHYTVEYMTAVLSASKNDIDKGGLLRGRLPRAWASTSCRRTSTRCGWDFSIEDRPTASASAIRFGLGAVKNVGQGPVDLIFKARGEGGPFRDLTDFARRVDLRQVGKRSLECLIKVGALDQLWRAPIAAGGRRPDHFGQRQPFQGALPSGQMSFFGTVEGIEEEITLPPALRASTGATSWNGNAS